MILLNNIVRVLAAFTRNEQELHGRGIAQIVQLSQKSIATHLEQLEKAGILTSRSQGNMRLYKLQEYTRIKDSLIIAETWKKQRFVQQHLWIKELFPDDERVIGIFGSYVRGENTNKSDFDIFIIGEKKNDPSGKNYGVKLDIKYFSEKEYRALIKENNPLVEEIRTNHVVLHNTESFLRWTHGNNQLVQTTRNATHHTK